MILTGHAAPQCIAVTGSGFGPLRVQAELSFVTRQLATQYHNAVDNLACRNAPPSGLPEALSLCSSCWLCICWLFPVVAIEQRCAAPAAGCCKPHHAGGMGLHSNALNKAWGACGANLLSYCLTCKRDVVFLDNYPFSALLSIHAPRQATILAGQRGLSRDCASAAPWLPRTRVPRFLACASVP